MRELTKTSEERVKEIASQFGLAVNDTHMMIEIMIPSIVRSIYRYPMKNKFNPETKRLEMEVLTPEAVANNKKLESFWKKLYNVEFPPYSRKVSPIGIFGPPGQGKTACIVEACKYIAKETDMDYISPSMLSHIPLEHIGHNSFVVFSQETATASSDIDVVGLPNKEISDGRSHMGRSLPVDLHKLEKAGMGCWIFDDVLNAIPRVQNMVLPIMQDRRYATMSLPHVYIGLTGNFGGLDGSSSIAAVTPLRSRIRNYVAYDTVPNFIFRNRQNPSFRDAIGDGFIHPFLRRYPQFFAEEQAKISANKGGFANSRGWESAIYDVRDLLQISGGRESLAKESVRSKFNDIIESHVGPDCRRAFDGYVESVLIHADPIARKVINAPDYSIEEMKRDFESVNRGAGKDNTAEGNHFAWSFANCLVEYTINAIRSGDSWEKPLERFGVGISLLENTVFEFALDELLESVRAQLTSLDKGNKVIVKEVKVDGSITPKRVIDSEVLVEMANSIASGASGYIDESRVKILSEILSGTGRSLNKTVKATTKSRTRTRAD